VHSTGYELVTFNIKVSSDVILKDIFTLKIIYLIQKKRVGGQFLVPANHFRGNTNGLQTSIINIEGILELIKAVTIGF
jgi:hypothetical protein